MEHEVLAPVVLQNGEARGSLGVGAVADVTVFDPDVEWEFRREDTASKAVNNPFYGWTLKGRNAMTIVAGEIAWQ